MAEEPDSWFRGEADLLLKMSRAWELLSSFV
jgi:hypothetical protein